MCLPHPHFWNPVHATWAEELTKLLVSRPQCHWLTHWASSIFRPLRPGHVMSKRRCLLYPWVECNTKLLCNRIVRYCVLCSELSAATDIQRPAVALYTGIGELSSLYSVWKLTNIEYFEHFWINAVFWLLLCLSQLVFLGTNNSHLISTNSNRYIFFPLSFVYLKIIWTVLYASNI